MESSRRLAAIMFTDIVGYTALMGSDVELGLELLHKNREIQKPLIEKHGGKWLKEMGDGVLAQFNSAIDSVRCALEIQKLARAELNAKIRIGIHLGDVTIENDDVFGDGVNIASRIQAIADPGGIYISESIHDAIRARSDIQSQFLGEIQLKNVGHLVKTYFLEDEGLPKPSKSKRKELIEGQGSGDRKSVYTYILAFLITVIAATGWWISNKSGKHIRSIAVLPVENLSENFDEQWLEAGIHQALIDEIGKILTLRVVTRTSTKKYQDSDMTIPEIATELKVEGIVEATFFKTGNNLSIGVRLIQVQPEERQIWNHTYDTDIKNVLSIYSDVAKSIAREANLTLTSLEETRLSSVSIVDPDAYEAYSRGLVYSENPSREGIEKAMGYFKQALDFDPNFALAYSGISWVWGAQVQQGFLPYSVAGPKAREAAYKALELDSSLVEVHWRLAANYTWREWDWERAGIEFRRTFDINPNYAIALAYYSHYLSYMGHTEEGLIHGEKAIKLDPQNALYQSIHGMALKNAGKYDEALTLLDKTLKTTPNESIALPALWAVYHEKEMFDDALEIAKSIYTLKQDFAAIDALERGNKEGGYRMAMRRIAEMMIARRESTFVPTGQIVTLYARAGMKDESLEWLDISYQEGDSNMPYISVDPLFDDFREDIRFKELMRKMNFPKKFIP